MKRKNLLGLLISLLLLVVGTATQIQGNDKAKEENKYNISEPALHELFNTVLYHMKNDYVDEVSNEELWFGAIRGMLAATGDAHTRFMTPDEFSELNVETRGNFGGIGIEISMRDSILTVVSPIEGTPGMRAGLEPGDKIVEINKESTKDMTLNEAVEKMRGTPGTPVTLSIARENETEILTFEIIREIIKIQVVSSGIIDGTKIGYIKLKQFSQSAPMDVSNAIKELQNQKVKGLILDLRWNPGGLLDAAHKIGNLFIKEGVIVSTRGRRPELNRVFEAVPGEAIASDIPLVVLVNQGSASASEIVTGAVKDHKRGKIVGVKTFGKGSVQSVIPLMNNTGIALTIQKYYTPSGESIHKKGILPDVEIEATDFTRRDKINYKDLTDKKIISEFVKTHNEYNAENVKQFQKHIKDKGYELSDFAAKYVLKQEVFKVGVRPLYDKELDVQLQKAISLFK